MAENLTHGTVHREWILGMFRFNFVGMEVQAKSHEAGLVAESTAKFGGSRVAGEEGLDPSHPMAQSGN